MHALAGGGENAPGSERRDYSDIFADVANNTLSVIAFVFSPPRIQPVNLQTYNKTIKTNIYQDTNQSS